MKLNPTTTKNISKRTLKHVVYASFSGSEEGKIAAGGEYIICSNLEIERIENFKTQVIKQLLTNSSSLIKLMNQKISKFYKKRHLYSTVVVE